MSGMSVSFPSLGVARMVCLFVVTLGAHPLVWFRRLRNALPAEERGRLALFGFFALAACLAASLVATTLEVYHLVLAESWLLDAGSDRSVGTGAVLAEVMAEQERARPYAIATHVFNAGYFVSLTWLSLRFAAVLRTLDPSLRISLGYLSLFGPFYLQWLINRRNAAPSESSAAA